MISPVLANYLRFRCHPAYNVGVMKGLRLALCVLITLPLTLTSQQLPQPRLSSSRLPMYPPLGLATRTEGIVRLTFLLNERGEVTEVHVVSGPKLLSDAALEDVKTWRFSMPHDLFRTEWRYDTKFVYRLSGHEEETNQSPKLSVSLSDFRHVEITSQLVKPAIQY